VHIVSHERECGANEPHTDDLPLDNGRTLGVGANQHTQKRQELERRLVSSIWMTAPNRTLAEETGARSNQHGVPKKTSSESPRGS